MCTEQSINGAGEKTGLQMSDRRHGRVFARNALRRDENGRGFKIG